MFISASAVHQEGSLDTYRGEREAARDDDVKQRQHSRERHRERKALTRRVFLSRLKP